jgi:hypothetical protein
MMATQPFAQTNHHDISLTLRPDPISQSAPVQVMYVGETVSYHSPDGDVTVTFPAGATPYDVDVVGGGETKALIHGGLFTGTCVITPPTGAPIQPAYGVVHDVQPH